jgi:uncharacterized membrane protein YfcA
MVLAVALAVVIGVSLGLLGGGGSILTVPILIYVVGLETKSAIATSLFVVGVTSAAAMIAHARAGRVRWRVGASFGAASMVGAFAGGRVAHLLPGTLLLAGFTIVMLITGAMMLRPRKAASVEIVAPFHRTAVAGVLVGVVTGMVGAGGGFVVVPALAMLCGLAIAEAIGTSLLVIAMNSLAGFVGYLGHAHVDPRVTAIVTAAAVLGSFGGALLAGRIRPDALRRGFAVFVLGMAALMIYRQLPPQFRGRFTVDSAATRYPANPET